MFSSGIPVHGWKDREPDKPARRQGGDSLEGEFLGVEVGSCEG